jgi:hypothetical protein
LSPFCAGAQGSGAPEVKFGEPFELQAGQTVSVGGELVLTFLAVAQDSRCPKGEQCITAGKARVRFEAAPRGGEPVAFELETGGASESGELEIAGYRITLLDLGPYPVTGRPIVPEAYTASLTVRKI